MFFRTSMAFALCQSSSALVWIKPLPPVSGRVPQEPEAVLEGLSEERRGQVRRTQGLATA